MDEYKLFLEFYLGALMNSLEGDDLQKALESTIEEERLCLEVFKKQISHCLRQMYLIDMRVSEKGPTKDIMIKRRAFEEQ